MSLRTLLSAFLAPAITLLIVGGGLFLPSKACADCGNYIVYLDKNHKPVDSPPMENHQPCHGPNCRQVPPSSPMPSAPPTLRILSDEPIPLAGSNSITPPAFVSLIPASTLGELSHQTTDIYHPPR